MAMKTINAKELRNKLEETIDDVLAGQDVVVTYRTKQPIRITASMQNGTNKKGISGLQAFDNAKKKPAKVDSARTVKDIYHEYLNDKYGK